jgi:hypothetical protein
MPDAFVSCGVGVCVWMVGWVWVWVWVWGGCGCWVLKVIFYLS